MIPARSIFKSVATCANKAFYLHPGMTVSAGFAFPNKSSCNSTIRRGYKGDAGDAMDKLSPEEEALLKIAKPKADEIFKRHIALPDDDVATRQKRLIYRSKQRGWLEVDLLLGTWASENVPNLEGDELDQFEDFVNMETIDIYNVITLRLDVPEHMKRNGEGVVERIQEWARSSPLGKADPDTYKSVKTEHKLI
mmetsp:Transcript_20486/g.32954  ORF Transcript_20486/g.32954 Transcript_20486/m.32954 type:complete len:194 (-) Transcript_20486:185-766(-)|eukprot:CAMPEP_0178818416 /NCGR_PEP_ID=MMETSP0746-20121128/2418_1 /TAXON_ID=913974 /ORGANISM="Nitzschia punctata, Strain CCMP561" /LENGTH=193 /DNA_ID=CAMNT_0020479595 /DNA_START=15 /DNA_END=596 /DNA_ORIENTATION=+